MPVRYQTRLSLKLAQNLRMLPSRPTRSHSGWQRPGRRPPPSETDPTLLLPTTSSGRAPSRSAPVLLANRKTPSLSIMQMTSAGVLHQGPVFLFALPNGLLGLLALGDMQAPRPACGRGCPAPSRTTSAFSCTKRISPSGRMMRWSIAKVPRAAQGAVVHGPKRLPHPRGATVRIKASCVAPNCSLGKAEDAVDFVGPIELEGPQVHVPMRPGERRARLRRTRPHFPAKPAHSVCVR